MTSPSENLLSTFQSKVAEKKSLINSYAEDLETARRDPEDLPQILRLIELTQPRQAERLRRVNLVFVYRVIQSKKQILTENDFFI